MVKYRVITITNAIDVEAARKPSAMPGDVWVDGPYSQTIQLIHRDVDSPGNRQDAIRVANLNLIRFRTREVIVELVDGDHVEQIYRRSPHGLVE